MHCKEAHQRKITAIHRELIFGVIGNRLILSAPWQLLNKHIAYKMEKEIGRPLPLAQQRVKGACSPCSKQRPLHNMTHATPIFASVVWDADV